MDLPCNHLSVPQPILPSTSNKGDSREWHQVSHARYVPDITPPNRVECSDIDHTCSALYGSSFWDGRLCRHLAHTLARFTTMSCASISTGLPLRNSCIIFFATFPFWC